MIAAMLGPSLLAAPGLALLSAPGELPLPSLWATLALGYVGVGAAVAWHLGRRGHALGTTTTALACWPLLLGLVGRPPPRAGLDLDLSPPPESGPNRARIDACVSGLRQGLGAPLLGAHPGASSAGALIDDSQLLELARALHRADHRIARVDRLLLETRSQRQVVSDPSLEASIATLARARDHIAGELEAVLAQLVSLRVQLGLFTLAGESEPVRERLGELEARVAALAELSSIELAQVQP